jgi:hypothetical protein
VVLSSNPSTKKKKKEKKKRERKPYSNRYPEKRYLSTWVPGVVMQSRVLLTHYLTSAVRAGNRHVQWRFGFPFYEINGINSLCFWFCICKKKSFAVCGEEQYGNSSDSNRPLTTYLFPSLEDD